MIAMLADMLWWVGVFMLWVFAFWYAIKQENKP